MAQPIGATLKVNNQMSQPLNSIANSIQSVINRFEKLQQVSSRTVNASNINTANSAVTNMASNVQDVSNNINQASSNQEEFNRNIMKGQSGANGLHGVMRRLLVTVGGIVSASKLISASDTYSSNMARLDLMNDKLQTTAELQDMIYKSAQRSRGSYTDMVGTVSKLGILARDAFESNKEMVRFSELMNKNFIIGGASAQEQAAAMYQLTQAMASGRLQGDEYRSIIENAPLLADAIKDYMVNVQKAKGSMKDWASEGLLTADVIKNALFNSADHVEERFKKMPYTFGQLWTKFKNTATMKLQQVYERLSKIANSKEFQRGMETLAEAVGLVANALVTVLDWITQIANFFKDNWSTIGPLIEGITVAVIALTAAFKLLGAVSAVVNLLTNPLAWIALAIVAIIALVYLVVDAINDATGDNISALGVIVGAIGVVGSVVYDTFFGVINFVIRLFITLWNVIGNFANFFGNVFNDPVGSIARLFFGLVDNILGLLEALASAIDWIFGFNLADAVSGWRSGLKGWVDDTFGKGDEVFKQLNENDYLVGGKRKDYTETWNEWYNKGQNLSNSVGELADKAQKTYDNLMNNGGAGNKTLPENVADTAKNTGDISNSLDITSEDLKYLRDIAEKEIINKFTTAEIKIDMTNNNNINSEADLDGIMDGLAERIIEAVNISGEGVYAVV